MIWSILRKSSVYFPEDVRQDLLEVSRIGDREHTKEGV